MASSAWNAVSSARGCSLCEFYFQAVRQFLRFLLGLLGFSCGGLGLLSGGLGRGHGFPRFVRGALGRRGRRHELEQQLKEAKEERDAATKAAGVIQAKLDQANEDIEKNAVILEEKDIFIKTLIQTPKGK